MFDIAGFFTFRTILLLFSTTFSILVVMVMVGIITVEDLVTMFHLTKEQANVLNNIVDKVQVVWDNILGILSQLINKLFDFAGIDVDLTKIHLDTENSVKDALPKK
jgi:amino acid permease